MNQEFVEIGKQLAQRRQEKGLSIEQLASTTKISLRFIEKMESGDFAFLPSVYVKAFLKVFAAQVGLDPEVTIHQFESANRAEQPAIEKHVQEKAAEQPKTLKEAPKVAQERDSHAKQSALRQSLVPKLGDVQMVVRFYRPLIFGAAIVVALLAFLIYTILHREGGQQSEAIMEDSIFSDTLVVASPPLQDTLSNARIPPVLTKSESGLKLTVYAKETTWVRIVFNDSLADEAVFAAGDVRSWQSNDKFFLKIGNAGGITLSLNGKDIGAAGAVGQIANLLIDRNGIARISSSQFPAAMNGIVSP